MIKNIFKRLPQTGVFFPRYMFQSSTGLFNKKPRIGEASVVLQ